MAALAASLFRPTWHSVSENASPDRPEILFSRAVAFQSRGLTQEALFYYGQAAEGGDPQVRRVALIEKARLAARYAATPL